MSGLLSDPNAAEDERRKALQGLLGSSILEELRQEQPDAVERLYASLPPLPVRDGQSLTMPTDRFVPAPPRHDDEPLRSFGLGSRNVIEGLLGLPIAPADAATYPTNLLYDAVRPAQTPEELAAGRQRQPLFQPQAQIVGEILDWLSLPRSGDGAGRAPPRAAGEAAPIVGQALSTDIPGQITGAIAPGLAGGTAHELAPDSNATQQGASLVGGPAPPAPAPPPTSVGSGNVVQPASVPPPQPLPSEVNPVLPPPEPPPQAQGWWNTPSPEPGRHDAFGLDRPPDPFAVPPAEGRWVVPGIPPSPRPADLSTLTPAGPDFPAGAVLTADGSLLVPTTRAEGDPNLHLAAGPLALTGLLNSGALLGGILWHRYRSQDGGPVHLPQPIAPMPELPPLITPAPEPTRPPIESLIPPAAPDMSTLITPLPDAEVAWTDPGFTPTDQDPAQIFERNILARRMRAAGIEIPASWEAHHIVPRNDRRFPEALEARERLTALGIGVNDPANGVALPGSYHRGIHTRAYYQELAARLRLIHSAEGAKAYLRHVAETLSRAIPAPRDQPQEQNGGG